MISESALDQIQESVSLIKVATVKGISLERSGPRDHKACCCFHDEKTPSMFINDRVFHCFGCGIRGNLFQLIQQIDNTTFIEAVKEAAKIAGVPLQSLDLSEAQVQHEVVSQTHALLAKAVKYWANEFKKSKEATRYANSRGISKEIAKQLEIGYCDGSIPAHLIGDENVAPTELKALRLINKQGNSRFVNRLVFPIYGNGRIINIYGRSLQKDAKIKHMKLKESDSLYGYDEARRFPWVYSVEACIDRAVMMSKGIENVIAPLGTGGFSEEKLGSLKRSGTKRIVILTDLDTPQGKKHPESFDAAMRSCSQVLNTGIDADVALLPGASKTDPADYFLNGGSEKKIKTYEPLRWLKEKTNLPQRTLVALRHSKLGQGPDKQKSMELRIGGQVWKTEKITASSNGLRCLLTVKSGRQEFKDKFDFWAAPKRKRVAKDLNITDAMMSRICNILEEQYELICEADKRQRHKIKMNRSKSTLPSYAMDMAVELQQSDTLIADVIADITSLGYVGEDANKALVYLIGLSAKLKEPLGCYIASDSGAGKSALVDVVASMFPKEFVYMVSRMTDQALYYVGPDDLKHKWLIVAERQGMGSEAADYNLRTFFSEKELTLLRPEKDETTGNIESRRHTVHGPIAYTETTTSVEIHDENATRLIELNIRESPAQTEMIHDFQREMVSMEQKDITELQKQRKKIVLKHRAFISSFKDVEVRIPFAKSIGFPAHLTRARRDLLKFLNIIKAIAFMHQHQRETHTSEGVTFIDANLEDYETAHYLARDSIRKAFSAIPERSQDLLKDVFDILKESDTGMVDLDEEEASIFTLRDLRDAGIKKSPPTIRKYMVPLIEQDLVEEVNTGQRGRGNAAKFRIKVATLEEATEPISKSITTPTELREIIGVQEDDQKSSDPFDWENM